MRGNKRQILSLVMALVLTLSLVSYPATAASLTLEFSETSYTVTQSDSEQTVNVQLNATSSFNICTLACTLSTDPTLGIVWTSLQAPDSSSIPAANYNTANGVVGWDTSDGEDITTSKVISFSVTVPANTAPGNYSVTVSNIALSYEYGGENHDAPTTMTATITVQAPSAAPAWEIYYTLDEATDSDTDKYIEYNPGDTVVATIYMKASAADTLQAFDFYVTNDANLEYKDYTSTYGTRIESGATGTAASTGTSQHIQAVGQDKDNPINQAMPANTGIVLATITYQVKDTAVYGTEMPITITAADFAVANNPNSFTPEIQSYSSDTLGVETLKTYTVTYDANTPAAATAASLTVTGMPATNPDTKQHNVDLTVAAAPSLTNYTFAGWNTAADGSGDPYTAGGNYTENSDVTLFAQWTPDTHKVEWKSQDGTSILETDAAVAFGAALSFDGTEPSKAADAQYTYSFAGWATSANQETGAAANTFTMGDADMVLYAAFSKTTNEYTVTWNSQDGNTNYETDNNVPYGTAPSFDQNDPSKAADATYTYTFAGWAEAANAESGTLEADLPLVDGNKDYYAAFSKEFIEYTISYALGDHAAAGETAPGDETKHNGETVTLPAGPAAADGYEFVNWSDGTNTYNAGATYTVNGSGATMTAQYAEKTYIVAYDGNGNTGGTAPASHTGLKFNTDPFTAEANTFERIGYQFNGWNTKADGSGTSVAAGASKKVSELGLDSTTLAGTTITLYAQWVLDNAWTISYELNGGSVATANPTSYTVETAAFTLNNPTKTGYTFKGWSGTGLTGDTNTTVTVTPGTAPWTGNLEFTANWTPAEVDYTVNHYQANLDGTYPATPTETETKQGLTEANTAAAGKTYAHFTAGHTTGEAAGTIIQETIAADGSTVVNIYYERETYTVTYSYTGDVPSGAIAPVDANSPYKYGATVTVENAPAAVDGYTFGGWSQTGTFVIDTDTTITGIWTLNTYHIYFKDDQGNVVGDQTFTAEDGSITPPSVPEKTDNKDWYDAGTWSAYDTTILQDQDVTPVYNKLTFTITFQDEDGNDLADQGSDPNFDIDDKTITEPAVPEKPGYTGSWVYDVNDPSDQVIKPTYTPNGYTITFVLDGGTDIAVDATNGITDVNKMTYNIESTWTLPVADGKANFTFLNWMVTATDTEASWASNSTINGGTVVTGKYGNVTLTAQWVQSLAYEVQEYKYAPADYRLLIVDDKEVGDGNVYTYDGATMYWTDDANYQIGTSTGVFYTLVATTAASLTDEQVAKIEAVAGTKTQITYDGDINNDGKINIADANAVFQMVVNTGSYYGIDQLDILHRLAADLVKTTANAEHRGSIEDVNWIVDKINNPS